MKKLIEAREAKVAELDGLVSELDEMEAGEDFDSKFASRDEEFIKRLTKEFSYLKEVLQMSKNEEWFKPIYNEYLNPVRSN